MTTKGQRKRSGYAKSGAGLVLPGPRRTTEARRRRNRIIWFVTILVLLAIAWLGYRELAGEVNGTAEFSGP
jgi:hypothetical protein